MLVFGGVGCLLVLLLCVGAFAATLYFGQDIAQELAGVESDLTTSVELEEELGSPLTIVPNVVPTVKDIDGVQYSIYTGTVTGPKGEGSFRARFTAEGFDYELQSLIVDANGKQIDVNGEEEFDLGIDLGE